MPSKNPFANQGARQPINERRTASHAQSRREDYLKSQGVFTTTHFPPVVSEAQAELYPLVPPTSPVSEKGLLQREAFVNGWVTCAEFNFSESKKILTDKAYEAVMKMVRDAATAIAEKTYS